MALNVTGGALSFEAEVSVDKALQNIKLLGDSFNNALQSNGSGKAVLDQLNTQLEKLTAQAKIYQDTIASGKVKTPDGVAELNKNLASTQTQIGIIQQVIKSLGEGGDGFKKLGDEAGQAGAKLENVAGSSKQISDTFTTLGEGLNKNDFINAFVSSLKENIGALATRVDEIKAKIKELESVPIGQQDFESIKSLNEELGRTQTAIDFLKQVPGEFNKLPQALNESTTGAGRLQTQLRILKDDLAKMKAAGLDGTPQFTQKIEEATHLEHAIHQVSEELKLSSSNVPGLLALKEGLSGVVGAGESVAGVFALMNGDESKNEEIIKNLIAAQTILNGVQEVSTILQKNSALNQYLKNVALAVTAKQLEENAVAETALAGAEELRLSLQAAGLTATEAEVAANAELAVSTEGATVAQVGLNTAMLANPVAIILAAIVALYGAYEILSNTIFKASEETKKREAVLKSLSEAENKAADDIAKETAGLNIALATAKDKTLSDQQRVNALEDIHAKYPEYLSDLNLENINTKLASDAIEKQTKLIKARAIEQASEAVYVEAVKEQIKKQNELNETLRSGAGFWQKLWATVKTGGQVPPEVTILKDKLEDIDDATIKADGAFENFQNTQKDLATLMGNTTEAINKQAGAWSDFGANVNAASKNISGAASQIGQLLNDLHKPFDPKQFEKDKQATKDFFKFYVDQSKEGTAANLQSQIDAQKFILSQEKTSPDVIRALANKSIRDAHPLQKTPITPEDAAALARVADIQKSITDLNEQLVSKSLQNASAAASALVLTLQAAGQKGSEAYFNAQETALKKAAAQQIFEAKDNAGQILQINAQLQNDIAAIEIEKQKQRLENEKSINNVRLTLVQQGSQEELDLLLKNIDIETKEQILAAGKNQDKINELNAVAEKKKFDLRKQYAIDADETELNIRIAGIDKLLAEVQKGSERELDLRQELIDKKAALDADEARKRIKNEDLLQAEILKINAQALADKKKAEEDYFTQLLARQFSAIDNVKNAANVPFEGLNNNPFSTSTQKAVAELRILENEGLALQRKINLINGDIQIGHRDTEELRTQLKQLEADLAKNQNDVNNQKLKIVSDELDIIGSSFKELSDAAGKFNGSLGQALATMSQLAGAAKTMVGSFEALRTALKALKADKAANNSEGIAADLTSSFASLTGIIAAVAEAINIIVQGVKKTLDKIKASRKEVEDFQAGLITGEQEYEAALRATARTQENLNKLTLQAIENQKKLLDEQKKTVAQSQADILQQLQGLTYVADVELKKKPLLKRNLIELFGPADQVKEITASLAGKSFEDLQKLFDQGRLKGQAKDLFEELVKLKQEGADIDKQLQDLQDKANQVFTGTTANNIADSIRQGLADGKKSLADFADDFNSLITNAILSAFEAKEIQPAIEEFYKKFAELSSGSGGALSTQQIQELRDLYNKDINQFTSQLQSLQQISGVSFGANSNTNSIVGGIKAMSEQTAEVIGGQLGGMRLVGIDQLSELKNATSFLNNIESNTALTAARLQNVYQILLDVTNNAKQFNIK